MTLQSTTLALNPDHYFTFDNDYTDLGTKDAGDFVPAPLTNVDPLQAPITADSTNSVRIYGNSAYLEHPDSDYLNGAGIQAARTISIWYRFEQAFPPCTIYCEGGGVSNIMLNVQNDGLMYAQVSLSGQTYRLVVSDNIFVVGRVYHICIRLGYDRVFELYINGVLQRKTDISPQITGHTGNPRVGDPPQGMDVGGSDVGFSAAYGDYAHFASWTRYLPQEDIISIFEAGALEDVGSLATTLADQDSSYAAFELDAVGGNVVSTLTTLLKSYDVFAYVNQDQNNVSTVDFDVTTTLPIRVGVHKYGYLPYEIDAAFPRRLTTLDPALTQDTSLDDSFEDAQLVTDISGYTQVWQWDRVWMVEHPDCTCRPAAKAGTIIDFQDQDVIVNADALIATTKSTDVISVATDAYTFPEDDDGAALIGDRLAYYYTGVDFVNASLLVSQGPYILRTRFNLPAVPSGVIWEMGGSGAGAMMFIDTNGELVHRAGDGGTWPQPDSTRLSVDVSAFLDNDVVVYLVLDANGSGNMRSQMWICKDDPADNLLTYLGSYDATSTAANWSGTDDGKLGGLGGGSHTDEPNAVADYNSTVKDLTFYNGDASAITQTAVSGNALTRTEGIAVNWPFVSTPANETYIRSLTALNPDDHFEGIATTGTLTIQDGQNIDGSTFECDTNLTIPGNMEGVTCTGALDFAVAGTYQLVNCQFEEVTNSSGGAIILQLDAQSTITTNTGPSISIETTPIAYGAPNMTDGTRYQLSHQQVFDIQSADITTGTDSIDLGLDSNGEAPAFDVSTAGAITTIKLTLADGATMPTTTPQLIDGGVYRAKTEASGVITLSLTEGGPTVVFTDAGTENGSSELFTFASETSLARGVVSGGSGLSIELTLTSGARVRRRAIHYDETSGETVTSVFFDGIFNWSAVGGVSDSAEVDNQLNPWEVVNRIASVNTIELSEPVENSNGVIFTSITPEDKGSDVTGLTFALEGAGRVQINAADADGLIPAHNLVLWGAFIMSTEPGMWLSSDQTMTTTDLFNAAVADLEIDETSGLFTKVAGMYIYGIRVAAATTGAVALNVATRGNGAIVNTEGAPIVTGDIADVWTSGSRTLTAGTKDTEIDAIKAKTDSLTFTGTDLQATLDGEEVTTDTASRDASKADVSAIPTNPVLDDDSRLNNLDVAVSSRSTFDNNLDLVMAGNMRGTDGANTTPPDNAGIAGIKAKTDNLPADPAATSDISGLNNFDPASDTVANVGTVQTTVSNSDMRGTDNANTVEPDNAGIAATQVQISNLENLSQAEVETAVDTSLANNNITKTVDLEPIQDNTDLIPAII